MQMVMQRLQKNINIQRHSFKNYTITGTFEDNLGNYGSSSTAVIAEYKEGNVINLQLSSKLTY